jgi:hypothetical protein
MPELEAQCLVSLNSRRMISAVPPILPYQFMPDNATVDPDELLVARDAYRRAMIAYLEHHHGTHLVRSAMLAYVKLLVVRGDDRRRATELLVNSQREAEHSVPRRKRPDAVTVEEVFGALRLWCLDWFYK